MTDEWTMTPKQFAQEVIEEADERVRDLQGQVVFCKKELKHAEKWLALAKESRRKIKLSIAQWATWCEVERGD